MPREQEPQGTFSKGPVLTRREFLRLGGGIVVATAATQLLGAIRPIEVFADKPTDPNKETELPDVSIVLSHIAGGEFMDETAQAGIEGRIFQMPNGTVVYLDNNTLGAVTTELYMGKGIKNPSADQRMELAMAKWNILNYLGDGSIDFAVLTENGIFAFHGSNEPVDVISQEGVNTIHPQAPDLWYKPELLWDERFGLVSTDEYRATHRHDQDKREWVAFPENVPYGTSEQRLGKYLQDSIDNAWSTENRAPVKNIFGIDPQDVADYRAGKTEGFKTFELLIDSGGKAFSAIIKAGPDGSPYGLRPELGDIDNTKRAIRRLDEIDPGIVKTWENQGYFMVITADLAPGGEFINFHPGYHASYDNQLSSILYNEADNKPYKDFMDLTSVLIAEGTALATSRYPHMARLDPKVDVNKGLVLVQFAETYKEILSPDEHSYYSSIGNYVANWYREHT